MNVREKLKTFDWSMIAILLVFMAFSTLLIHSAIAPNPKFAGLDQKNAIYFGAGFIVLFGVSFINYKWIVRSTPVLYVIGIIMLITVYFFGVIQNGARGWFSLPFGLDMQPAELEKLLLILMIAYWMARRNRERLTLIRDVLPIALLVLLPFVLVIIQPDLGNAMIYPVIALGMLWIGNIKYTHVLLGTTLIVAILVGSYMMYETYHDDLKAHLEANSSNKIHWIERIDTFLNPELVDPSESYHVRNAIRAIGSGGLFGEGYKQGNSVQKNRVPYTYSDSIFAVVGEEFGFLGSSALLLLYFLFIYRMILISLQCRDPAGSYIIIGIISMFVFQIFQSIGMLIGLMPLTGITLPFISYGGSSLMLNMLSLGIVMSIKLHQGEKKTI